MKPLEHRTCIINHPLISIQLTYYCSGHNFTLTEVHISPPHKKNKDPKLSHIKNNEGPCKFFCDYLASSPAALSHCKIDLSQSTPFQKAVLSAARSIPYGTTVSYAKIAQMAGYPKAFRAVAAVLRNNRFPLVVPCHRIIAKDGSIGGFMGTMYGPSVMLKRNLLLHEGVDIPL